MVKEQLALWVIGQIIDCTHQSISSIKKIRHMLVIIPSKVEVPA